MHEFNKEKYESTWQTRVDTAPLYAAAHGRAVFELLKPLRVAVTEQGQSRPLRNLQPNRDDVA